MLRIKTTNKVIQKSLNENHSLLDTLHLGRFLKESSHGSPIHLKKHLFESFEDYCRRINGLPAINIGLFKPQKELYNSKLEIFPGFLETYKWVEGYSGTEKEAFLKIDKENAKELFSNELDHPVFSQFKVVNDKLQLVSTKLVLNNLTFDFCSRVEKEFSTIALSAFQGDPVAQFRLGEIYYNGELGQAMNVKDAVGWYQNAYLEGNAKSLLQLIHIYIEKLLPIDLLKNLEEFLEKVLIEGTSQEQFQFAKSYAAQNDFESAAKWYRKAALQGNQEAASQLLLLEKCKIVPQDKKAQNFVVMENPEFNKMVKLNRDERKFSAVIQSIKFMDFREVKLEVTDCIGELHVNDKLIFYRNGRSVSTKNHIVKRFIKINGPNGKVSINIYFNGSKNELETNSDQVRVL